MRKSGGLIAIAFHAAFGIPALAVPTITVTSPNGGEVFASGSSQMITWTATNPTGNVYIDLYKGGVFKYRIYTASMSSGSYWWYQLCTASADASNYRIRITWTADATVTDNSDAPFTITAPNPTLSLTLSYPNGGETLTPGPVNIAWNAQNFSDYVLVYLEDANTSQLIGDVWAADGQMTWNICAATRQGSDFRIRLRTLHTLCDTFLTDQSDAPFTVSGTNPVTITSPAPGAIVNGGSYQRVFWSNGALIDWTVNIYLVRPGYSQLLGQTYGYYGGFDSTWACPSPGNASDYRLMLTGSSCAGNGVLAYSAPFTIDGANMPQSIAMLSPNGGETITAGQTVPITWASTNLSSVGYVQIYLVKGTQPPLQLAVSVPLANGSWNWTVPYCWAADSDYKIRIRATSCNNLEDLSDAPFTIANARPPLRITSPNGGESLHGGSVHRITWDSSIPIGGVLVWLTKGGEDYQILGVANAADGGIDWPICDDIGDGSDYRLKVATITDCNVLYDESDAAFSILTAPPGTLPPAPTLTVTAPQMGESIQGGTTYPITWTSTDPIGNVGIYRVFHPYYPPYAWSRFEPVAVVPMAAGQFQWSLPACASDNPASAHDLVFFYGCGLNHSSVSVSYVHIPTAPLSPGDVNGDCAVDLLDAAVFVQTLLGQDTDLTHLRNADINRDYIVDGRDVAMFVVAILP